MNLFAYQATPGADQLSSFTHYPDVSSSILCTRPAHSSRLFNNLYSPLPQLNHILLRSTIFTPAIRLPSCYHTPGSAETYEDFPYVSRDIPIFLFDIDIVNLAATSYFDPTRHEVRSIRVQLTTTSPAMSNAFPHVFHLR